MKFSLRTLKLFRNMRFSSAHISLQRAWRISMWLLCVVLLLLVVGDAYIFITYGAGWKNAVKDVPFQSAVINESSLKQAVRIAQEQSARYEQITREGISVRNPFQFNDMCENEKECAQ